ncbi:BTAD domain-containing putative transcriptional regulator [Kibdelosporangium aridum]|nr:BTAD domain-containing putative transcriptional regulator [Kibdelosporangium aridum]
MCVDTHRFRALINAAREDQDDAKKVTSFREALAMWQGPPLADVAEPEIVDQLCGGLQETRIVAMEECLDAELRLGRHAVVIDELTELVARYPYRQRLLAQLMLALHRSGRAADALSVYQAARQRLVRELGLDPDPPLRQLEHAILRADPAIDFVPRNSIPKQRKANGPPAVETFGLTKRYGSRIVLDDVSFTAQTGRIVGLVGPTGSGKTTVIRLLSTLLPPTSGHFTIAGVPSSRPAEMRNKVGVLSAEARCPGRQTGLEHLTYHARLFGLSKPGAVDAAGRLLAAVGLDEHASTRIGEYTPAMCRFLALARALVHQPAVLLLDEPTSGLDPAANRRMLDLVRDVAAARGTTVILSSNDMTDVEQACDQVLILDAGVPVVFASVGELMESSTLTRQR